TVRCFPNNKPWIISDVKDILNQKKRGFKDGNWTELKRVQRELKVRLKEAKESYSIHHPVVTTITLTSTISVTFTTITLTSTISVITTNISRKTKQHPQFPLSPNLHDRPSQETAEETTPQTKPQVHHAEDPLQFAYREKVGVEDAILYLLHRAHSHLDKGGCAVRVMFFDFSSAFNTIQPLLLRDKLMKVEVDMHLVTWITDYLTGRTQHVRIRDCSSDTVISSTGAPQGTVLSPVLFTVYTSDFKYNSELCHMQKFSDDTAIVGCVPGEGVQKPG
ncbi:hypothetical protein NFI96_020874, partial [Prochilodus magdalenae]